MVRKGEVVRTYGRHRQRTVAMVTVAEVWDPSDGQDKQHSSVFSLSSSSSDNSISVTSNSGDASTLMKKQTSRVSRKTNDKENVSSIRKQPARKSHHLNQMDSSMGSEDVIKPSSRQSKRTALREMKNNATEMSKLDAKLKRMTKKPPKVKNSTKNILTTDTQKEQLSSCNFSEFEDYSLIVSDSPAIEDGLGEVFTKKRAHSTPGSLGKTRKKSRGPSVETSTPFCMRHNNDACLENLKDSDLSHIELIEITDADSNSVFGSRVNHVISAAESEIRDKLSLCSANLEQLCQSYLASSPTSLSSQSSPSLVSSGIFTRSRSNILHSSEKSIPVKSCKVQLNPLRQSLLHLYIEKYGNSNISNNVSNYEQNCGTPSAKTMTASLRQHTADTVFDNSDSLFSPRNASKRPVLEGIMTPSSTQDASPLHSQGDEHSPRKALDTSTDVMEEEEDLSDISEGWEEEGEVEEEEVEEEEAEVEEVEVEEEEGEREDGQESGMSEEEDEQSVRSNTDKLVDPGGDMEELNFSNSCYALTDLGQNSDWSTSSITEQLANISMDSDDPGDGSPTRYSNDADSCRLAKQRANGSVDTDSMLFVNQTASQSLQRMRYDSDSKNQSALSVNCTAESDTSSRADDKSVPFQTPERSRMRTRSQESLHEELHCVTEEHEHNDEGSILEIQKSFCEMLTPAKRRSRGKSLCPSSKVLLQCEQTSFLPFLHCFTPKMVDGCVKIGEGVYGEVFRTQSNSSGDGPVALKVIPIEGDFPVNDEAQKTFDEILPEILISRELSSLRDGESNRTENFVEVNRVSCVKGRYPKELLTQWDQYHKNKGSENDRPDLFDDSQLFIVFEFADGGLDLESFQFQSIMEARSVIQQVAYALAVAEVELEFEHRDLHWGNVLVRNTTEETVTYMIQGVEHSVITYGVQVSIIDFTLSRLQKDGCTVFCDLSKDETLFEGTGDYQFDIYRQMKERNGNQWEPFSPYANVMWLHYLVDKVTRHKRYRANNKTTKNVSRAFRAFTKDLLQYESAHHLISSCEFINS